MIEEWQKLADQLPKYSQEIFDQASHRFHSHGSTHAVDFIGYTAAHMAQLRETNDVLVTQILGYPGSGKSFIAERLGHALPNTIVLSTDDYNRGTRKWRQEIISNGGSAKDEKDFGLFRAHLDKLQMLRRAEGLMLPSRYDPQTGLALENGLTRPVRGRVNHIIVDSNFHIGHPDIVGRRPDLLVYLHMDEAARFFVRCTRDLATSQKRADDATAIFHQMVKRTQTQDLPYTLPFMREANVLAHVSPTLVGGQIRNMSYEVYEKK